MKLKLYAICYVALSSSALAQEIPHNQNVFFEKDPQIQPDLLLSQPSISTPTVASIKEGSSVEESINFAIVSRDWEKLESLLNKYRTTPNFDPTLYDYALGALYRHQGRQKEAIALYQHILKRQPDLYYPRFDLAMMLYEDKRYSEAKVELETAQPHLAPPLQDLVNQLLGNIKKTQAWQPTFNFSYKTTDNVNQASDLRELVVGGATFIRGDESLPQSAHGIRFGVGASKEKNLAGNHYIYTSTDVEGVRYWDNKNYSEQTLRVNLGYRYKDIKQSVGVIPVIEQNFLGGNRYNQNYGGSLEYNQRLSNQWQFSGNISHLQKRYADTNLANYYDGHANSTAWLLLYQPQLKWLVYGGIDYMRDDLADEAESSNRQGVRAGGVFSGDKIGVRGSIRYAQRDFFADNFWYDKKRKDDEYQFDATMWHKNWVWRGFIPKLNYNYQEINSNLPLYERSGSSWFMTVEKDF